MRYDLTAQQVGFVELVHHYGPWNWWSTWTFAGEWSVMSCAKTFEKFMRQFKGARYLYVIERNRFRNGHHIHALVGGVGHLYIKAVWRDWFEHYGRCHIDRYKVGKEARVGAYVAKYMAKGSAWWDIKGCEPLRDLELWNERPRSLSEAHLASGQLKLPKRCAAREMSRQTASLGQWEMKAKQAIDTNKDSDYDRDHEDITALTNQTARKRVRWTDGR